MSEMSFPFWHYSQFTYMTFVQCPTRTLTTNILLSGKLFRHLISPVPGKLPSIGNPDNLVALKWPAQGRLMNTWISRNGYTSTYLQKCPQLCKTFCNVEIAGRMSFKMSPSPAVITRIVAASSAFLRSESSENQINMQQLWPARPRHSAGSTEVQSL